MDVSSILSSMAGSQAAAGDPALRNAQTPAAQRKAVAGQFEAIMLRQMLSGTMGSMLGGEDSPRAASTATCSPTSSRRSWRKVAEWA